VSTSKGSNKIARIAERKRLRNRLLRHSVKTYIVQAKNSADAGEESAHEKTKLAISNIDKAVGKRVFHKNKGARLKSQLMKNLNRKQRAIS
jgi:small subunit ribosomal protein S20